MTKPSPTAELFARLRSGRDSAASEAFAAHRALVAQTARRFPAAETDDVVQETFLQFFAAAREGRVSAEQSDELRGLLRTIAGRQAGRIVRSQTAQRRDRRREQPLAFEPAIPGYATLPDDAIRDLSPDDRLLVEALLDGIALDDIASALGCSSRTIRRRVAELEGRLESSLKLDPLPTWDDHELVIERMFGAGGYGRVYRARVKRTGGHVAVKFLRKQIAEDFGAVIRFRREIAAGSQVRHRHLVRTLGLGRTGRGIVFALSELFPDGPVRHAKRSELGDVLRQTASGLDALHAAGLVHGDLKPANILRSGDRVAIADFGHVAPIAETTSMLRGTLGYMAPEQIDPTYGRIGPATDCYALGMTLLEWLRGEPAAPSDPLDAITQTLSTQPWPVPESDPLYTLAAGLVRKRPEDRLSLGEAAARL